MNRPINSTAIVLALLFGSIAICQDKPPLDFDRDVAPLLIKNCLECHSGDQPKGGLDLTTLAAATKGGESGAAVVPGKMADSRIWLRIEADEMPPKKPLATAAKQTIRDWITGGAKWGKQPLDPLSTSTDNRAGYDWWALQPVQRPDVPKVDDEYPISNPIDAFVMRKLKESGLASSPGASPKTRLRRWHFDLLGLPPSPDEMRDFEDSWRTDPKTATEQTVDRLLQSPHFGERWGRHWLDVVRFGESQGFERDKIRLNSWHYRDWVIRAINDDMPYDEFARYQIAGDILKPEDPSAVTATGFLVAGPWDEVGQSQRSTAMKAIVRQDEIEDYVGTISQTFLGLTVNCARCHDHKFDPITQKEYYQLASAVGGVRHGSRNVTSQQDRQKAAALQESIRQTQDKIASLEAGVRNRLLKGAAKDLPPRVLPIARWDFEQNTNDAIGKAHAVQHPKAKIDRGRLVLNDGTGYAATHPVDVRLREKTLEAWGQLDNLNQRGGAAISIHTNNNVFDAIVFGERESGKWMAGSDFFKRTQNLDAPAEGEADKRLVHMAIAYHDDGKIAVYRNGKPYGTPYQSSGPFEFNPGEWYVLFGLRTGGPSAPRQLRGFLEAAQLYDRALSATEVLTSYECEKTAVTHDTILKSLTAEEQVEHDRHKQQAQQLNDSLKRHRPYSIYAVNPQKAEVAHLLKRGNPATPDTVVSPGGVAAVKGTNANFGIDADSSDEQRRRSLALWVSDNQNPLFARVIVNRLWHHHFGVGLVETPNDFGFNGGRPSHLELLDWLAAELVDSGWRLKHIHRLIVTSATYCQSSAYRAECAAIDADNRLLWRKSPRRMEAEVLRDSILSVSGQLNLQYGGAPYRDFETFTNNTQFYTPIDPDTPDAYRRTVYRTWVRSGRNYLLDAFDCPDPSTTAPQRAVTTTPIQSLALMNGSFVLRMSERFAERVVKDAGEQPAKQVERAIQLTYGRGASEKEIKTLSPFITKHGLAALCRVLLNSNEFIHVD